jgi:DNA-binding HxlR family transcriptional regulator
MLTRMRRLPPSPATIALFEQCLGCKWTLPLVQAIGAGIHRPGRLRRSLPGISKKVLNERIDKLLTFGLARRCDLGARVPHVEYRLTALGRRFSAVLARADTVMRALDAERSRESA